MAQINVRLPTSYLDHNLRSNCVCLLNILRLPCRMLKIFTNHNQKIHLQEQSIEVRVTDLFDMLFLIYSLASNGELLCWGAKQRSRKSV